MRTELVEAEDEDGLVDLEAEDLGLDKGKGLSVDLDKTLTGLCDASSVRCAVVFACALLRSHSRRLRSVPCSGRQRWRSSSCRSIARIGRPF